jgi:DNA polymerase-3 subunit epsilon
MDYYTIHPEKAICLDVETTGVDPSTAEIVQLSIINYNGNTLFNEYIKPDKAKIWPGAEAVHHISPLKVLNKPHLSFYQEKLKKIFDSAELIIAYNGDHYDIPIIARYGFPELREKQSYDVMLEFAPIYGAWDDYHGSYTWQKLSVCADYYGYHGDENFHDSLEDVRATLFCYKKMIGCQKGDESLPDDLEAYSYKPEDSRISTDDNLYEYTDDDFARDTQTCLEALKLDKEEEELEEDANDGEPFIPDYDEIEAMHREWEEEDYWNRYDNYIDPDQADYEFYNLDENRTPDGWPDTFYEF